MDDTVGFKSRPLSAEQVVALFQQYTPRSRFSMKGSNPHRRKLLTKQRSVRFHLEGPPPLPDRERGAWERDLNQEYQMNQMLRYNRTPRSTAHIKIFNLHHRDKDQPSLQDDELLLKLSRQAVADAQPLDRDSCALQNIKYPDRDDISFMFNLYNCLARHHAYHSRCSHHTLRDFLRDIQSIGYLLADGVLVTAYDVFVRLVRLDETVAIAPCGTHYTGPVIGVHSGMLRALPWFVTKRASFLATWFPHDVREHQDYQSSDEGAEPTPPVLEIDTSSNIADQDILRPLQFGESVSCRFLDTGSIEDGANAKVTKLDVPVSTLYEEGATRSANLAPPMIRRGQFKPQPSRGDLHPDERLDHRSIYSSRSNVSARSNHSSKSNVSARSNHSSKSNVSTNEKPPIRLSQDITVVFEVDSCATETTKPNNHDISFDALPKKTLVETDTTSTAGDSTWTFHHQEEIRLNGDNISPEDKDFDDYASWFHSTVDDNVTILTYSSSEVP